MLKFVLYVMCFTSSMLRHPTSTHILLWGAPRTITMTITFTITITITITITTTITNTSTLTIIIITGPPRGNPRAANLGLEAAPGSR